MSFSKLRMGKEEIFEVVVKDMNGMKVEEWRVMKQDFLKVTDILRRKYNLKLEPKDSNSDLDWLR